MVIIDLVSCIAICLVKVAAVVLAAVVRLHCLHSLAVTLIS